MFGATTFGNTEFGSTQAEQNDNINQETVIPTPGAPEQGDNGSYF